MKCIISKFLLIGCAALASQINAATVIAVNGESAGGGGASLAYHYGGDDYTSIIAVSWTNTLSFSDVAVFAQVASNNPIGSTGQAFLTTSIGSGATVADQVAATSFVFPAFNGTFSGELTLFTGLTLPPGTYFLTIATDSGYTAGWNSTQNPIVTSDDPGATTQPPSGLYLFVHDFHPGPQPAAYLPASAFIIPNGGVQAPIYAVTGTMSVPEPATIWLFGVGFLAWVGCVCGCSKKFPDPRT